MTTNIEISESLARLIKATGKDGSDLARYLGVLPQSVTNWGKREVSKDGLKLASEKGINSYWLQTGNGSMYLDGKPVSEVKATGVADWDDETPVDDDEIEAYFFKDLALACGAGAVGEALDTEQRRLRISKSTLRRMGIEASQTFAIPATDNSMSPIIQSGDVLWVDQGRKKIRDGRIFAIEHGGMFRCKRLYQLPHQGVRIVSENSEEYPEEILNAEQVLDQEFRIIGWIWQWSHEETW